MIPRKTVEIVSADGEVDIVATYGSVAVALEAPNGDVAFTTLDELNEQTGTESASSWETDGIPDGKIIYGRFCTVEVSSGDLWIHLK